MLRRIRNLAVSSLWGLETGFIQKLRLLRQNLPKKISPGAAHLLFFLIAVIGWVLAANSIKSPVQVVPISGEHESAGMSMEDADRQAREKERMIGELQRKVEVHTDEIAKLKRRANETAALLSSTQRELRSLKLKLELMSSTKTQTTGRSYSRRRWAEN